MDLNNTKNKFPVVIFITIYLMGLLIYMLKALVGVSFPFLKDTYNLNSFQLGNIAGVYFWTYSFSFLVLGLLTRKIGVKKHSVITYLGIGICEIAFGLSNSYQSFLLIKGVEGIVSAGFFLCAASIVSTMFSVKHKKQVQSYQISSIGVSSILIAFCLVPLMNLWSWRTGYIITGILSLLIAVLMYFVLPEIKLTDSGKENVPYFSILLRKTTFLLVINMFIINLYLYTIMNFAVLYFVEAKKFTTQIASSLASVNALSAFFAILICGFITKYFRPKIIYFVCIIIIAFFSLGIVLTPYYVVCMALGYGISLGAFSMLMALVQQIYSKNEIPIASGVVIFGGALGGAVAPSVFGFILSEYKSYDVCFVLLFCIVILSLFTIMPIKKTDEINC